VLFVGAARSWRLIAADVAQWVDVTEEWDPTTALTSDVTRPRGAQALPAGPRPCGCTSADDRECEAFPARTESGCVCLCICHERLPEDP
jgi:hypothetical protein